MYGSIAEPHPEIEIIRCSCLIIIHVPETVLRCLMTFPQFLFIRKTHKISKSYFARKRLSSSDNCYFLINLCFAICI